MSTSFRTISACATVISLLVGCSEPQPLPFKLIDSESKIQKGTLFPEGQKIEVVVDDQLYKGFYIVANGIVHSETLGGWRYMPRDTISTYSSNSARAQLVSDKGQHLKCDFLFESRRAIGECRSPAGMVFQMTADGK